MPKKEHKKVAKSAQKAGLRKGTKAYNAYVYGTVSEIERRRKAKRKGQAAKRKSPQKRKTKKRSRTRKKARKR